MTTRIVRSSVIALVALVAGGCGSAASKQAASTRPTTPPKLSLTKADGRTAAADSAALLYPARLTSYVLDGSLPDLGTQATVYRWTAHAVDIAEVNRLADALGINAAATTTPDGFQASDGTATLTVTVADATTQVSYFPGGANAIDGSGGAVSGGSSGVSTGSVGTGIAPDNTNPNADPATPPGDKPVQIDPGTTVDLPPTLTPPVDVPSAADAETIARELLDRAGVLAGQQWDTEVTDSGGIAVTCAVGAECSGVPASVTARDVTFHLVIGGVRVEGIAWTVTIGERSHIESVYGEWGSAVVLGTYDLRSTADAFDALKRGDGYFGGVEPLAGEVPVKAQDARETAVAPPADQPTVIEPAPPVDEPPVSNPPETVPSPTDPPAPDPIVVHVTGVSLGIARWSAVDSNKNVVDLVPTYVFHTSVDGSSSDITQLALDPAAIDFAKPIVLPAPVPEPGKPTPEPLPAPDPRPVGSSSGSGSAPAGSKATPTS